MTRSKPRGGFRRPGRPGFAHEYETNPATARWHVNCVSCGKRSYAKRKHAKAAIRRMPQPGGMNEYECPATPYWHIGHLPAAVRRGEIARGEIYGPKEAA